MGQGVHSISSLIIYLSPRSAYWRMTNICFIDGAQRTDLPREIGLLVLWRLSLHKLLLPVIKKSSEFIFMWPPVLRQGPPTPVPVPGLHRLMLSKEEGAGPGRALTRSPRAQRHKPGPSLHSLRGGLPPISTCFPEGSPPPGSGHLPRGAMSWRHRPPPQQARCLQQGRHW